MTVKAIFVYFTSVLLMQTVYSQCACGNSFIQPSVQVLPSPVQILPNTANIGNSINLANGVNFGNNLNAGLALNNGLGFGNGLGLGNGLGFGNGLGSGEFGLNNVIAGQFNVISGSPDYPAYPNGVTVTSTNEIGGIVAVAGGLPFAGSAYYDGNVASSGQAGLTYSSGQGIGLSSSGCGYGLAGYQGISGPIINSGIASPNVNTGLSGLNLGLSNANVINSGLNLAVSNVGCNSGRSGLNFGGLLL